jgi:hydrogenase maturation factor
MLPVGKLPADLLAQLLKTIPPDPSVLIGAGIGRDAAAVRAGSSVLVLKTDPITFATDEIGWYVPNVNANDVACMGARPRWMLVTALLPEAGTTAALVSRIFDDLRSACSDIGVSLIGGHTEITSGLTRPILIGLMAGEAEEADLVDPSRAGAGDVIILARGIAIEGTALIARERGEDLSRRFGAPFVDRCRGFLHDPGISVVRAATALHRALGPALHGLHDPTEGGLATGLREIAAANGCGLRVRRDEILIYPETATICAELALDPLGLIASGALVAVVDPAAVSPALDAFQEAGIPAAAIGTLVADPDELVIVESGRERDFPAFAVDEIARLFSA